MYMTYLFHMKNASSWLIDIPWPLNFLISLQFAMLSRI